MKRQPTGTYIPFVKDNIIQTPPLSAGGLEGITRDAVIQIINQDEISSSYRKCFPLIIANKWSWAIKSVSKWIRVSVSVLTKVILISISTIPCIWSCH